jgi:hypothetical protein
MGMKLEDAGIHMAALPAMMLMRELPRHIWRLCWI